MNSWKRVLLINLGLIAGWVTALLLVPRDTRFWPFVLIAVAFIALIDVDIAINRKRGAINMPTFTKTLVILFLLWLCELAVRRVFA